MTSTEQIRGELLAAIVQLGRLRPDWRLGQTLANLATTAGRLDAGGVWDLDDKEALAAARALIDHYAEFEPAIAGSNPLGREDCDKYLAPVPDVSAPENHHID